MINEQNLKRYCCGDFTKVENYAEAIADTRKWVCHHRLELTEEGELQYSYKDLIEKKMYNKRPSEELILLTKSEHTRLHNKARKGSKNPMYGKTHSDDSKEKMSKWHKGRKFSGEHCENISNSHKGRHWYNNGIENKFTYDCPEGFVKGRLTNWQ